MVKSGDVKEIEQELDRALKAIGTLETILTEISHANIIKPGILFNYYRALMDLKEAIISIKNLIKV